MIVVTGATGQLGPMIVQQLVGRVPVEQIGASARDPGKAVHLQALGVRVRHGDFDDPASLRHSFEGATQVLIVSSNAAASGGDPLPQHRAAIEAARAVGARRIVYTAQVSASAASAFPPGRDHAATEDMLRDSGLAWTSLRHGFYAESAVQLMGDFAGSGVIEAPADGRVAWATHADLAEADAMVLANEGRFDGPTPPFTGAEALDLDDLAVIASDVLGRPVRRETITDGELRARIAGRGAPQQAVDTAAGIYAAGRAGEFAAVDPTLERLLGRRPTGMREVFARTLAGREQA